MAISRALAMQRGRMTAAGSLAGESDLQAQLPPEEMQ